MFRSSTIIKYIHSFTNQIGKPGIKDDYEVLAPLGKGSSSRVFLGVHIPTSNRVVIKIFKKLDPIFITKQMETNLKILQFYNKKNQNFKIIPMKDWLFDQCSSAYTIIYQYYAGITLNNIISTIKFQDSLKIMINLAQTLKYIHQMNIIHRDIKPANVLVTKDGPRIFDFGLSKFKQKDRLTVNNFGTKCYKTPEVVYRFPYYNQKADIWALGLIFAQLCLNKRHLLPYINDQAMLSQMASLCDLKDADMKVLISKQLHDFIKIKRFKSWKQMGKQKNIPQNLIKLISSMIQINPIKRNSLDKIIKQLKNITI